MPLPWYISNMSRLWSYATMLVYPFILGLESLRGAFVSAMSLSLFLDIPTNPVPSSQRDLANLNLFLAEFKIMLDAVPEWAMPMLGPWFDYYWAAMVFADICNDLILAKAGIYQLPPACIACWVTPGQWFPT